MRHYDWERPQLCLALSCVKCAAASSKLVKAIVPSSWVQPYTRKSYLPSVCRLKGLRLPINIESQRCLRGMPNQEMKSRYPLSRARIIGLGLKDMHESLGIQGIR